MSIKCGLTKKDIGVALEAFIETVTETLSKKKKMFL